MRRQNTRSKTQIAKRYKLAQIAVKRAPTAADDAYLSKEESAAMVTRDSIGFVFSGSGSSAQIAPAEFLGTLATRVPPGFGWLHLNRADATTPVLLAKAGLDHGLTTALNAFEIRGLGWLDNDDRAQSGAVCLALVMLVAALVWMFRKLGLFRT